MDSPWLSYVPRHVALDLLAAPGTSPIGRESRFQAVALFADVSGFTAMSEALGRGGRQGTEELTTILNSYFEPMIVRIQSYGGIVGKFGGDALTVLFPYTPRSRAAAVRRALQCALDMQADMGRYAAIPTSAGTFSLAMKAGLAVGRVFCTSVGDPDIRLEYVIAGQVLDLCADAEHHATRGEVVVHDAVLDSVPAGTVVVAEARQGFSLVADLRQRPRRRPLRLPGRLPPESVSSFARYVHPAIAQRVQAGLTGFINEHRRVTVLFVSFSGFDYDGDPRIGDRLQLYLSAVIRIVHRYDGYLNKVDMGDKGSKYIVLFGAPVAHENDEERAVHCALELSALPDCPTRIGLNAGFVYCGQVGSSARQEYTVIGDAVNLAARLMQAARPGQILASSAVQRSAARAFTWQPLAPISVKGKSEPVEVFAALGVREISGAPLQERQYALPMVGREQELRQAEVALARARGGHGQVIGLSAEAGMGKSRLSAEIVRLAAGRGFAAYGGACHSHGTQTPYLVWRDIWRGLFELDPAETVESQARHLAARLEALDPRLAQRAPLLGPVLNLALPDNDLTRTLDAQLRADLLKSLLLDCLRLRARAAPALSRAEGLLLVLEDCDWIDPLSQELLEFIGRNLADLPVVLLVLYRPPDRAHPGPLHWAAQLPHASEIRLEHLTDTQAQVLVRLKLEQLWGLEGPPPAELVERLMARAQGNPFFLEEMLNYIRDRGLDPRDAAGLAALDLPDSLHSLIISRIDQLAESEKTTLKVASVIGRLFSADWLWGSYPQVGAAEAVRRQLQSLSQVDLTPLHQPEPELQYLFKHVTTQEVAYESLAFATRAALHEAVARFIEHRYAASQRQFVDVLAYHYGRSHNLEKQKVYFRLAGDAAKAAYANQAAVDHYQRLLAILPEAERGEVHLELGEIWQLTGRWGEADAAYRQALALAGAEPRLRARCQTALASLLSRTQSYAEALQWLEQALAGFRQLDDQRGIGRVMEQLSFAHFHQGDYPRALACAEQQLQISMRFDDLPGQSAALDYMGIAHLRQGEADQALAHLQRSLDIATASGYRRGMILACNDMAGVYWMRGEFVLSLARLQQALEAAAEIGYLQSIGFIIGNAGLLYEMWGDSAQALACYGRALQIAAELGDWPSLVPFIANLAGVLIAQGQVVAAEPLCVRAVELARSLNVPNSLCEDLYLLARLHSLQQRPAQALPLNQEAQELAAQLNKRDTLFQSQLLAVRLRLELGGFDAPAAVAELELLAGTWTEPGEQAALRQEMWRLIPARESDRLAAADRYRELYAATPSAEYRQRYAELTGQTLPDPPPLPPLPPAVMGESVQLQALLERVGVRSA